MPDPAFDIGEDIAHQRKVWRIERISWTLMGLSMLAALLGFAGHGMFSARELTTPAGLVVMYQRFERKEAQTHLSLRLPAPPEAQTRVRIAQDFLGKVEILRIDPEPERSELTANFTTWVFDTAEAGTIHVHYTPLEAGTLALQLGLDAEEPRTLTQFVFP